MCIPVVRRWIAARREERYMPVTIYRDSYGVEHAKCIASYI